MKQRTRQINDRAGSGRPELLLVCAGSGWKVMARGEVITDRQPLELFFPKIPKSLVALEVGSHSPRISRLLEQQGHEVVVANARRVKLIAESSRKNDDVDAELLARLVRADRVLLSPVKHRGARRRQI